MQRPGTHRTLLPYTYLGITRTHFTIAHNTGQAHIIYSRAGVHVVLKEFSSGTRAFTNTLVGTGLPLARAHTLCKAIAALIWPTNFINSESSTTHHTTLCMYIYILCRYNHVQCGPFVLMWWNSQFVCAARVHGNVSVCNVFFFFFFISTQTAKRLARPAVWLRPSVRDHERGNIMLI